MKKARSINEGVAFYERVKEILCDMELKSEYETTLRDYIVDSMLDDMIDLLQSEPIQECLDTFDKGE